MRHITTIPEGTLIIEVIPGDHTTGFCTAEFLPRLKLHGTLKAGQTYHVELRRELRRLPDEQSAADAASHGIAIQTDNVGSYHWRAATGADRRDKAKSVAGQRAIKTRPRLEAIADRECHAFHLAHPGWEQYSLRLRHILAYQRTCDEAMRAEIHYQQLAAAAQQLRHQHQLTDAETTLEVPR